MSAQLCPASFSSARFCQPVRSVLQRSRPGLWIGGHPLRHDGLVRFNDTLAALGAAPMTVVQLATACRNFAPPGSADVVPEWIRQRMRSATMIGLILADPCWRIARDAMAPARTVMDYVVSTDDLIPDTLPRVGRLDDALVVEASWPLLGDEIEAYIDYQHVRMIEAEASGCELADFAFDRRDWARIRQRGSIAWTAHCRDVIARRLQPAMECAVG